MLQQVLLVSGKKLNTAPALSGDLKLEPSGRAGPGASVDGGAALPGVQLVHLRGHRLLAAGRAPEKRGLSLGRGAALAVGVSRKKR